MTSVDSPYRNSSSVFHRVIWWLAVFLVACGGEYFVYNSLPIMEFTLAHFAALNGCAVMMVTSVIMLWRTRNADQYIDDAFARESLMEAEAG